MAGFLRSWPELESVASGPFGSAYDGPGGGLYDGPGGGLYDGPGAPPHRRLCLTASSVTVLRLAVRECSEGGVASYSDPAPEGHQARAADRRARLGTTYVAVVETNCGSFEITLDATRAHRSSRAATRPGTGASGPGYTIRQRPPTDLKSTKASRRWRSPSRRRQGPQARTTSSSPAGRSTVATRVRAARQGHQRRGRR
jgi:hypothetical protein